MGLDATLAKLKSFADVDASAIRALVSEPWAISDAGRRQLAAVALQALQARPLQPLVGTRQACVRDGVAVVPVCGPLTGKASFFSMLFGGSDYETIAQDMNVAMGNDDVRAILLDVDSPGGLVAGAHDASQLIRNFRGKGKPIYAFVGGMCASAAYWIAASCDQIIVSPTALVGSIGCFASLMDDSELMAKLGLKRYDVASEQSPLKIVDAANEDDRARVKTWVTDQASVFIADVAVGRGRSDDEVKAKFGRGDIMVGAAAQKAGLVDAIGDFESVMAALAATPVQAGAKASKVHAAVSVAPGVSAKTVVKKMAAVVKKAASKMQPRASRAETKEEPMADMDKLKEHAEALHGAAQGDHDDAASVCSAIAPHMKALHVEMGDDSPFADKDDDEEGNEAKAFVAELGGVKAARGALAAMQKTAAIVEELRKENAKAKADKEATEVKAMLDEAMTDGRLNGAADRTAMEKDYAAHGVDFVRACLQRLPKKAAPAREPSTTPAAGAPPVVANAAATAALTPAEISLAQRRGKKPEEFAAFKAQYMTALNKGVAVEKE